MVAAQLLRNFPVKAFTDASATGRLVDLHVAMLQTLLHVRFYLAFLPPVFIFNTFLTIFCSSIKKARMILQQQCQTMSNSSEDF